MEQDFALTREDRSSDPHSSTSKGELTAAAQGKRRELLAGLAERSDGTTGYYYMDRENGYVHGFGVVAYQVLHDVGLQKPFVVPIREAETFQRVTDKTEENCIGWYRRSQIEVEGKDCAGGVEARDPSSNVWGGTDGLVGVGDAWTKGYFLIAELEQIFVPILNATLCVTYQSNPDPEFSPQKPASESRSCRDSGKWNALDPVNGMPRGDWCSTTNGPATDDCHDAYLTIAYHAFAASNVQETECEVPELGR